MRNLCARLSLPRSEWTYYFIQGLRPEIRDYVILQQANHLDEAENFAQLKEFVLASSDKTPTSNTQQLLAQVIEKLSAPTRSEDKTLGAFSSQQNDFDESGEMRRVIREELQQIVKNPDILTVFQDNFAIIGISVVLIVVEMDTHNVTARQIQTRNVTMSVMAREQISP